MQKLTTDKRAAVLRCLIEGNSILSTSRITGAAKNTIVQLLAEAGEACSDYQDKHMRNLPCKVIQLDEVWSFVGCKEKNKKKAKAEHPGDVWTWTSICADTKLIPSWRVGDRGSRTAYAFSDHQWTLEEVVEIIDAYHAAKEAAAFEAAFEAKWTRPRSFPKTYTPTPKDRLPVPWYLDVNSGVESGKAKSP